MKRGEGGNRVSTISYMLQYICGTSHGPYRRRSNVAALETFIIARKKFVVLGYNASLYFC